MQVRILNIDVETTTKPGGKGYKTATVAYMSEGQARTQKVVDFANPEVFKQLPSFLGAEAEVTVTKNSGGYNQWSAIKAVSHQENSAMNDKVVGATVAPQATRVTGSNYETPAERAQKQVYIVKQSSISNAIELAAGNKEKASPEDIITTAQKFVDWVFGTPKDVATGSLEDMKSDIPY